MSYTLFISDLHLCAEHARSAEMFRDFMAQQAPGAEALYILGDLFEAWPGDDDMEDPFHAGIIRQLRQYVDNGGRLYMMHGNRDLLMGADLERACGASLLPDPVLIDLYGRPVLLTHGDQLCTDDHAYQAYRKQVSDKAYQAQFLTQPLPARKAFIAQLREHSKGEKQAKSAEIMDVNQGAVQTLLRQHHYPTLIHGHTHRPAHHILHVDGHTCERWVLSDWDSKPRILRCDISGAFALD